MSIFFLIGHIVDTKEEVHPTPAEQAQAEANCKADPTLMGCDDPYYY
jgi:hypothetical protein